jgi:hypothetical protein
LGKAPRFSRRLWVFRSIYYNPQLSYQRDKAVSSLDRDRRFTYAANAKEKQVALPAPP